MIEVYIYQCDYDIDIPDSVKVEQCFFQNIPASINEQSLISLLMSGADSQITINNNIK